ncbi:MAG: ABC transporter ATP-binding protein/permease [Clostridia bacterium]|nr:ABC transporter ATP-binding protein/permease [Clostridia bacterium]
MRSILRYMMKSWKAVCIVILLLMIQAYCDLSLPTYMSNIVDVGIQQNGMDDAVMQKIRADSLEQLELFMTEDEIETVEAAYQTVDAVGIRLVKDGLSREEEEALSDALCVPMALVSQISGQSGYDVSQIQAALEAGLITRDQLLEMKDQALEQMGEVSDSTMLQMAALYMKDEYEAMGVDLGAIRNHYLYVTGGKMLGLTAVGLLAAVMIGLIASRVGAGIGRDLRTQVFGRVLQFSSAEMNKFSTASLITRCTNDIQQVQMVCVMMLRIMLFAPICGIGGILKVYNTRTGMGWIIAVAVCVIIAVIGTLIRVTMPKFRMMQSLIDRMNLVSREILTGIMPIRAFSREKREEERFAEANTDLMRTQLFTNRVMNFMMPTMMLTMNGVTVAIVWFGSKGIEAGNLQVGDMMAFITYTMMIVMSFMMMTMISIFLPRAGIAADRINEVIHTELTIADKPELKEPEKEWKGEIRFEDVTFCYPGADHPAIEHISFTAEPGKTTAIIGSTGCGKSTLLNLIPRFFDVTEGSVKLDGVDVRDIKQKTLRQQLGYVPQKGVLFSGDIASNLKFADQNIPDDQMKLAAEIAQATEFIDSKMDRYHTHIAQGGTNVSGGQKQRLSIARAIAADPKVYLFDDSFSALDYKTDAALRRALNQHVGDATVIIVAQRISTILHADQIIVLNEGRIDGIGTHEELLVNCNTYREIAESQLSESELKGGGVQ